MFILRYDAYTGIPFRDGEVEFYINAIQSYLAKNADDLIFLVSTENIINGVRCAVKDGRLALDQIRMEYNEYAADGTHNTAQLTMNAGGRYPHWPAGYCDTNERYIDKLIDWTLGSPDSV